MGVPNCDCGPVYLQTALQKEITVETNYTGVVDEVLGDRQSHIYSNQDNERYCQRD